MTNQEAFDRACRAIIEQGRPSYDEATGRCMYRSADGARCAIGHLIPDSEYQPSFEGDAAPRVALAVPSLAGLDHEMLDELQTAHDNAAVPDSEQFLSLFRAYAREVANEFNLSDEVLR